MSSVPLWWTVGWVACVFATLAIAVYGSVT